MGWSTNKMCYQSLREAALLLQSIVFQNKSKTKNFRERRDLFPLELQFGSSSLRNWFDTYGWRMLLLQKPRFGVMSLHFVKTFAFIISGITVSANEIFVWNDCLAHYPRHAGIEGMYEGYFDINTKPSIYLLHLDDPSDRLARVILEPHPEDVFHPRYVVFQTEGGSYDIFKIWCRPANAFVRQATYIFNLQQTNGIFIMASQKTLCRRPQSQMVKTAGSWTRWLCVCGSICR